MNGNLLQMQPKAACLPAMQQAAAAALIDDEPTWAQWSLDRVEEGIALLDPDGRMHFANRSARELLNGSAVLAERGGRLVAAGAADQNALSAALAAAAQRGLFRLLCLGSGQAQQFLLLSPMDRNDGQRRVLCKFGRRTLCNRLSLQWYANRFHLSPAESNVLQQLCDGADPEHIAGRKGVALTTVRTQIGSIREKTGHRSVRDLLRTLAMLPVVCSSPTCYDRAA